MTEALDSNRREALGNQFRDAVRQQPKHELSESELEQKAMKDWASDWFNLKALVLADSLNEMLAAVKRGKKVPPVLSLREECPTRLTYRTGAEALKPIRLKDLPGLRFLDQAAREQNVAVTARLAFRATHGCTQAQEALIAEAQVNAAKPYAGMKMGKSIRYR
jgi:hypothetical protein